MYYHIVTNIVISEMSSLLVSNKYCYFRNVLATGLKDPLILPQSNKYDIPLCVCVVDIDFDGCNEILIGTYGQVMIYIFILFDIV